MKKILFFFLMLAALLPAALKAQEVVEILGDGGENTSIYLPAYTLYNNTLSEQIYTADEIGTEGLISSIAFFNGGNTKTPHLKIYLVHTDQTEFASESSWLTVNAGDLVFEGDVTLTADEWTTIEFTDLFMYDGASNLGLIVDENMNWSGGLACRVFTSTTNCSMYVYSDGVDYDAVGASYVANNRLSEKNQIKLEITPSGGITCAKPETLTVSDITSTEASVAWTGSGDEYIIQFKKTSQGWEDEDIYTENTTSTEMELTDLDPSTTYNLRVASVCGSETSLWRSTSFRTECGSISSVPVIWDFETDNLGGTSSYPLPSCWNRTGANYPSSYEYDYYALSGSYILSSSYNPVNNIAILPAIDYEELPLNTLQLRFFARMQTSSGSGTLEVGLMSDITDANSFIPVGTISSDNGLTADYVEYEVSFADYEGDLENPFIALRMNGESSNYYSSQYIYMDDIVLEHIPACALPTGVAVSNVTSTSADITVNDPAETGTYRLYILSGEELDSMDVNTTTSLTDLTPGTSYTVSAATICDDGSITRTVSFTFTTLCETMGGEEFPYLESFDAYSEAASTLTTPNNYPDVELPSCWLFLNRSLSSDAYPQAYLCSSSDYALSGNCLFFKSSINTPLYAVLPLFEENIHNLMLSFSYRNENIYESNGTLSVGYMTNPFDASSFVEFLSCPKTTDITRMEQLFNIVPEDVENAFIAFRYSGAADNYYLGIDSVVVDIIPDCIHPAAISVNNITSNSAEVVVEDPNEINNYHIIVKIDTTIISEADITSVNYPLDNLEPNTTYSVSVYSICDDGTATPAISTTFTTECDFLTTLPQVWDFENLDIDETNDYPLPACWSRTDSYYPYLYTGAMYYNYAHSGSTCLYSSGMNKTIVLPPFNNTIAPINTLQMSFYARCYAYYSYDVDGSIEVGVMTDPLVDSTFVSLASFELTSSYELYEVLLNTAPENAPYIALRLSTSDYTIHLDDVSVDFIPSCVRPASVTANNITNNSADISIVDPNEAMHYLLLVDNGTAIDTIELQDTVYALMELSPATNYTVSVATICENDSLTNSTSLTFQTSCDLITSDMLPKIWNFESNNFGGTTSYPLPTCWSRSGSMYPYVLSDDYNYGYSVSGTNYLYTYCYSPSTFYIFLPEIDVENVNLNTLQLRFSTMVDDIESTASIELGVLPDPTSVSSFIPVSSVSTSTGITTEYDEFELSLAGYEVDDENESSHLALRINLSGYYDEDDDYYYSAYLYIDDVVLETLSSCPRPNNFVCTGTTQTTVSLAWDDDETPNGWNVVYGPAGFNPNGEDVEQVSSNENTVTIENLTSGTAYDFYVQANCGGDEVSNWRGPINAIPGSYNIPKNDTDTLTTCDIVIYDDGGVNNGYSTNCDGYLVLYPEQEGSFMQVTGSFDIEYSSYSRYDYLQIFDGDNTSGTLLFDSYLQGSQQGNLMVVSSSGPLTLFFHSDYSTNYDGFELHASCVTCAPPTFTVAATSGTEAVVTITSNTNSWDLMYGEHGFNPEEGVVVENLTNTTYTVSNLEASTSYDFYVRTNCDDGESDWAGPVLISTPCLSVIVTNDDPFVEDFNTLTSGIPTCWDNSEGTTTNDSYKWSYYSSGESGACVRFESYLNTTANTNMLKTPLLDISALSTPTLRFSYKNPAGGDFSVFLSTDGGTTYTSAIAVGLTGVSDWTDAEYSLPDVGNASTVVIVFRGISNYGTGSQISCSIYLDNVYVGNGDTVVPVGCNAPTNVTATEVTKNSAIINWEQEGTPDSWTVSYKKNTADTWTTVEGLTAHPYTLTNLDPATVYNVNVKAVCGTLVSAASATINFETLPDGVNEYVNSTVLYPNPTIGQFTIYNEQCTIENVEVYDIYGKLLNSVEVNDNKAELDVTGYASGIYFTRIYTDKGMVVKQIVKK